MKNKKEFIKLEKENLFKEKAGISYLQILILIISSFAFSYIIYSSSGNEKTDYKQEAKENLFLKIIKTWFSRSKINLVSAITGEEAEKFIYGDVNVSIGFERVDLASLSLNCCPKLKESYEGASCQDLTNTECSEKCSVPCLPTKCELTSNCKLGCCYDEQEGLCSLNTPQQSCTNGKWDNDKFCNIEECRLGCCVLGSSTQFVTEKRCEKLTGFYGLQLDFRGNINSEIECLALSNSQAEGACIIEAGEEKTCKFTTKSECLELSGLGNFYENYLCSNPELKTNCEKQVTTSCIEERDEVYWFDSCGNRENIYSSDKTRSYNNGKVLKKEDSCNSGSGNIESKNCGNCNYFLGSICGKGKSEFGNYVCKDLNCKDAITNGGGKKDRKQGESWCIYDSFIGNGKDAVGSRHYKYYCIDGQVKSEGCGDYRTGICVESEIDTNNGKFSNAACRPNRAMECLSYNAEEENKDVEKLKKECQENSDCEIRNLNFGEKYEFSICSPRYPPGFDLKREDEGEIAKTICNQANFQCKKIKVKKLSGWECVAGCDCDSASFTQQMNEWCISLGDCGMKANIAGEVTEDGYSVSNAPRINSEQYEKFSQPVSGQKALPGNFSELMRSYYGWGAGIPEEGYEQKDYTSQIMMGTVGAYGVGYALAIASWYATAPVGGLTTSISFAVEGFIPSFSAATPTVSAFGSAAIGAAIGAAVGLIVAKSMGLEGQGALFMAIGGGLIGTGISILITLWSSTFWNPVGWILIAIGAILMAVTAILKIGKVKEKIVTFTCNPWQAPREGDDCGKCTGDLLKPCTKYKCSSLGQTCQLLNEGTGQEICENIPLDDINPPIINPWYSLISSGYKYDKVSENSFELRKENGECLTEFNPVIFGISTNKASQCKLDTLHTSGYGEMSYYFGDSSLYKYNHSMAFNMPSVESLLANIGDELSEAEIANLRSIAVSRLGNLTFYIRCSDKNGNSNLNEYLIRTCVKAGPDLTAPYITNSLPRDNSYLVYNLNSTELKIWVNEPADCKYDSEDKSYELMENEFSCLQNFEDVELYGWGCLSKIDNLVSGENKIYIKCKDQPWLTESSRNIMRESKIITLKKSLSELKITKIEPNGTITSGTEPATVILTVKTEGGAENGKSECEFSFTNDNYIQFLNTFSSIHAQELNQMLRGSYNVYVKCEDVGGNEARGTARFKVKIDRNYPQIIRVYNLDGLKVITDEDAECVYSEKGCNFVWQNATVMTGILKEHTANYEQGKTYYIKCKDLWDNKPDSCSIIIKAG